MLNKEQKASEIKILGERFGRAKAAFLVDYKGLNVEEVTRLRKTLSPLDSELRVVKNTLARLALKDHPEMGAVLLEQMQGTNAVVFAYGDVSSSAKALLGFADEAEKLEIKTGVMDGRAFDKAKLKYLAALPGKDQLRAQLLGVLAAPMSKFLGTLNAVPSSFVRVLSAHKDKTA